MYKTIEETKAAIAHVIKKHGYKNIQFVIVENKMTEKEAEKMIANRAKVMAKDEKVIEFVRRKFGNDLKAGQDYVYKLAIATLYGQAEA